MLELAHDTAREHRRRDEEHHRREDREGHLKPTAEAAPEPLPTEEPAASEPLPTEEPSEVVQEERG